MENGNIGRKEWEAMAEQHRAQQAEKRDAEAKALSSLWASLGAERKAAILARDATALLRAMAEGELTSEEISLAYTERAYHIGCLEINAVTETFFAQALADAKASDARRARGEALGALEGLPISLKDCFDMKGSYSTVGITARVLKPGRHQGADGLMVQILRDAGAIPIAKTNVPRGLLEGDTYNLLYGATLNPWDLASSPGGSSGGEGALVAARGSPLGFGTDIGGSVRIPSAVCGIYGFKCTVRRLSTKGLSMQEGPGQETVLSMPGPMARSVDDCVLAMKVWLCHAMWRGDASRTAPVPFRDGVYTGADASPLPRIALLNIDYSDEPSKWPAMIQALNEAAAAFRAAGAEVVEWVPRRGLFAQMASVWLRTFAMIDELAWYKQALDGESAELLGVLPQWLEKFKPGHNRDYVNVLQAERRAICDEYLDALDSLGVDLVLCASSAAKPSRQGVFTFTEWVNLLGLPAGIAPVLRPHAGAAVLPRSVQLVGRPWADETVLRAMKTLESAFPIAFPEEGGSPEGPPSLRRLPAAGTSRL